MGAICLDGELGEMGGALLGKWFACGRPLVGKSSALVGKSTALVLGLCGPSGCPCLAW